MDAAFLATATSVGDAARAFLLEPLRQTAWTDWHGFWLNQIFADRLVVIYALPLALPLLWMRDPRRLRIGVILSGLAFITYVMGALYAAFWLLLCLGFHRAGQAFARATQARPHSRRPVWLAGGLIVGWWLVSEGLKHIVLPPGWAAWLAQHAPWVYPLGERGVGFEPQFSYGATDQWFRSAFRNLHNIGAAYLTMRMLHYFSELRRGTIPAARRGTADFLAYMCYGPNLMQGPIERYVHFQQELDTCTLRRGRQTLGPAAWRIGWGIAKNVIAALYFAPIVLRYLVDKQVYYKNPRAIESYALLYFGVYIQIFTLYLQFSGYCDISAGIARLLGIRQVENFNWPWLATSLRDFWRRWHISLSSLLRDYLYIPLGGNRRHVTLNLIITFALCGLWHSLRFELALWGAVMGLMLAINQAWVHWMARIDAAPRHPLHALRQGLRRLAPLPSILCWALTMHFFVHSLLIFFGGSGAWRVYWELIRRPLGW